MEKDTILLVDNDVHFLETQAELLENEGFRVVQASSVNVARQKIGAKDIDLVILDIRLVDEHDEKDFSGINLAKEIDNSLPKIILTQYPSAKAAREISESTIAVDFRLRSI